MNGLQQAAARQLDALAIRLANVVLQNQVEERELLLAQALFCGAALFGIKALKKIDEPGERVLDGDAVLFAVVVGNDLSARP